MFNVIKLYMKIRRYFFNFDTIMKKFAKAGLKMSKFQAEMAKESRELHHLIDALGAKRQEAINESERAARVADRIAEFLS